MLTPANYRWDETAEIVILGYGLAGAVAAITAHDLGARVMLIEKQPAETHCSTSSIAMGVILSISNIERATEYMTALCQAGAGSDLLWTDADTIRAWVKYTAQNQDWIARMGGNIKFFSNAAEFPQLPGADSLEPVSYTHLTLPTN